MSAPQTEIVALVDGREVLRTTLPPGEYLIGRDPEMHLCVEATRVSRRHAKLTLNYFDWLIEDLHSANGTHVGALRIAGPTTIFPSQPITLGNAELHLRRLPMERSDPDLAPQTQALFRYFPLEIRGPRRHRIRRVIARGGMGVVVEAEDLATKRVVAMKVLLSVDSAEHLARFIEEAQITAQLEHPNIIPIYELNVNEQDKPYYTMPLVRGHSLKEVVEAVRGPRPDLAPARALPEMLRAFLAVCDAVGFAHAKGVIHRDLKPQNIMLGRHGEVLVMDWGLAKPPAAAAALLDGDPESRVASLRQDLTRTNLTTAGAVLGTPYFMAPEQATGDSSRVDFRADVYSLGALLYYILTLRPPVEAEDILATVRKVAAGEITPPPKAIRGQALPHLGGRPFPETLAAIALKALSLRPGERHVSAEALAAEVSAIFPFL
jgi:serine/threonine protein kinase